MTAPDVTMSPQVTAALLSGGAAMVVAVLGIAGAIGAQLLATRRAFANSLALFEREYARQEREKALETHREDIYRFAEQRRNTYARLLLVAADLRYSRLVLNAAAEGWLFVRDQETDEPPDQRAMNEERRLRLLQDADVRWLKIRDELEEVAGEVELLASADVRQASGELGDIVSESPDLDDDARAVLNWPHHPMARYSVARSMRRCWTYEEARKAFLDAARTDLGIGARPPEASDAARSQLR